MSEDAQDVVLVVEDEPVIRMILKDYLQGEGYHVLVAEDGEQAFKILASKPHLDLIVTDFRLPGGISGVQIAEQPRQQVFVVLHEMQHGSGEQQACRLLGLPLAYVAVQPLGLCEIGVIGNGAMGQVQHQGAFAIDKFNGAISQEFHLPLCIVFTALR